jgi:protein-disulfide isomerase
MPLKESATQLFTFVALGCTLVTTTIVVRRELFHPAVASAANADPVPVKDWERLLKDAHVIGRADAPVKIITFADFECPSCKRFATKTWKAVFAQHPNDVAFYHKHWPLPYHKQAYPAARAAECAAAQQRFEAFHDLLYTQQDSLGAKPFERFAREAGVPDLAAFKTCASRTEPVPVIDADAEEAHRVGGSGTPTVIVQGLRLPAPPDSARLEALIQAALEKRSR